MERVVCSNCDEAFVLGEAGYTREGWPICTHCGAAVNPADIDDEEESDAADEAVEDEE